MKKALCLIAVLALVATAGASVRVFVTGSDGAAGLSTATFNGLTNAWVPTVSTVYPNGDKSGAYDFYYHVLGNAPAVNAPSGTSGAPVLINSALDGEFAYIWFQFQAEAVTKVNGLKVEIRNEPSGTVASLQTIYYKQDNRNAFVAGTNFSRWDGSAISPYPEWVNNNPQTMVGVDAQGLQDATATPAAGVNWNMYTWQAGGTKAQPLVTGVSLLGVANGAGHYSIRITDLSYSSGATPALDQVSYFNIMPEPASLLLMGLAGLLLRRR